MRKLTLASIRVAVLSVVAMGLSFGASADAATLTYVANLDGAQAGTASTGTGTGTFTIDTAANTVTYSITFSGLGSAESVAHIHGFSGPGVSSGVVHSLATGSPKNGVWNYSAGQEADILAGLTYVNIHSSGFPGGEIRGQIVSAVTLNEIRVDQSGADTDEFMELAGPASSSLAGLALVVIGDGSGAHGTVEDVIRLTTESLQGNGLWTVAEATCTGCGVGCPTLLGSINLENTDNVSYMLVADVNDSLKAGSDLDANDDGIIDTDGDWGGGGGLDGSPWSGIPDCVAIRAVATGGDSIYCSTVLGPAGGFAPAHFYVCPDSAQWVIGSFSDLQFDTPCEPNPSCSSPPPSFTDLTRTPCVPAVSQSSTVTVVGENFDSANLNYTVNGGSVNTVAMSFVNATTYTGVIPGQASNEDLVEYTVDLINSAIPDTVTSFARGYFVGTTQVSTLRVNDANGVNLYRNYGAKVTGNVTAPYSNYSTSNTDYYMQDATGGINIFKFGAHTVQPGLGDDITVEGELTQFNGKLEITSGGDCDTLLVEINGPGAVPAPLTVTTCDISEATEGLLIRVENVVLTTRSPGDTLLANSSSPAVNCVGSATFFVDGDAGIAPLVLTSTHLNVTGIGGQFDSNSPFSSNYQIMPRNTGDITFLDQGGVGDQVNTPIMRLHQNYPNPFGRSTQIRYEVPAAGGAEAQTRVVLTVFDIQGRAVRTLVDGLQSAGEHIANLDARDIEGLSNGIYFYRLEVGEKQITRKLMLVR